MPTRLMIMAMEKVSSYFHKKRGVCLDLFFSEAYRRHAGGALTLLIEYSTSLSTPGLTVISQVCNVAIWTVGARVKEPYAKPLATS